MVVADVQHAGEVTLFCGYPIKYFVLLLLTIQNAGAVLMMRWVRSMPGEGIFVTQTAVVMQELLKGLLCVLLLFKDEGGIQSAYAVPHEALKTAIPALLYLFQNNLQYVGITYLDAATYTVTYQTKILFSGVLSMVLLGRTLTFKKWVALVMITCGVAAVQLSGLKSKQAEVDSAIAPQRILGLTLILAAACFSSLAGVSFEKFLKGVKISLWARNLQLAFYSAVIGWLVVYSSKDAATVNSKGFFYGYTPMTWSCIAMNAFGGLLVGTVLKYADAVLKDVALGLSISLSTLLSSVIFDFEITALFVFGMLGVLYAAVLYGGNADCCGILPTIAVAQPPVKNESADPIQQASEALTSLVALATGEDDKNVED